MLVSPSLSEAKKLTGSVSEYFRSGQRSTYLRVSRATNSSDNPAVIEIFHRREILQPGPLYPGSRHRAGNPGTSYHLLGMSNPVLGPVTRRAAPGLGRVDSFFFRFPLQGQRWDSARRYACRF